MEALHCSTPPPCRWLGQGSGKQAQGPVEGAKLGQGQRLQEYILHQAQATTSWIGRKATSKGVKLMQTGGAQRLEEGASNMGSIGPELSRFLKLCVFGAFFAGQTCPRPWTWKINKISIWHQLCGLFRMQLLYSYLHAQKADQTILNFSS